MTRETTDSVIQYCKREGFSVTAFAYAALCHSVCLANPPSSWPVRFSAPLQPISQAGKVDSRAPVIQCAMSTIPITWELAEGQSQEFTASVISKELHWATRMSVSALEPYISAMLEGFKRQLSGGARCVIRWASR